MAQKTIKTKKKLIGWLRSLSEAIIISISLVGNISTLQTNIQSPSQLATAIEKNDNIFPFPRHNGPYIVEYEPHKSQIDTQSIPFSNFAVAYAFKAELVQHKGTFIGGLEQLIKSLSQNDFPFYAEIIRNNKGSIPIGSIKVVVPQTPTDLNNLKDIFDKYASVYAFPDNSHSISPTNIRFGNPPIT